MNYRVQAALPVKIDYYLMARNFFYCIMFSLERIFFVIFQLSAYPSFISRSLIVNLISINVFDIHNTVTCAVSGLNCFSLA